jgi:hypothetical protein
MYLGLVLGDRAFEGDIFKLWSDVERVGRAAGFLAVCGYNFEPMKARGENDGDRQRDCSIPRQEERR